MMLYRVLPGDHRLVHALVMPRDHRGVQNCGDAHRPRRDLHSRSIPAQSRCVSRHAPLAPGHAANLTPQRARANVAVSIRVLTELEKLLALARPIGTANTAPRGTKREPCPRDPNRRNGTTSFDDAAPRICGGE